MKHAASVMGILVVACGASTKAPSSTTSAVLASFATSDLVTVAKSEVTAWKIVGDTLENLGSIVVPGASSGEWADRDHLFLTTGRRKVVMVTAQGTSPVALPPDSAFEVPKPPWDGPDPLERGGDSYLGIGDEGQVGWAECAWNALSGEGGDHLCHQWVNVILWPTASVSTSPEARISRRYWPSIPAPAGSTAKPDGEGFTHTVTCALSTGAGAITYPEPTDSPDDNTIADVDWVSATPPGFLVSYGHMEEGNIYDLHWDLYGSCTGAPLAKGTTYKLGPAGLWVGRTTREQAVYRGATSLRAFPSDTLVVFRPPT